MTLATESDIVALKTVHRTLQQKDLLPDEHLLDAGYVDVESLVTSKRDFGVAICSPVREKVSWQSKAAEGFDLASFQIDWEKHEVTCPKGQTSAQWCGRLSENRKPAIQVRFSPHVCRGCPYHTKCTQAKSGACTITFYLMNNILYCNKSKKSKPPGPFGISMPNVLASRALSLRLSGAMGSATPVTSD